VDLKIVEGCDQLAWKIEALFSADSTKQKRLKEIPLQQITRVVPVLVVQDHILRGPFVNWKLNQRFNEILNKGNIHPNVTVDSLNVVGIQELETMAESAEAGTFDIFHGLQLRCFKDPDMKSELQEFLSTIPGYGNGKSERIERIVRDQFEELAQYSFGKNFFNEAAAGT
jgi:hypothetical protein